MRIGIVIPSLDTGAYILEAIESVLAQRGSFDLELVVVDGGSRDATIAVLEAVDARRSRGEWQDRGGRRLLRWTTEPDDGLYAAVAKGLNGLETDILAWLGADDIYLPGALAAVARTFGALPRVRWLKGITDYIDARGTLYRAGRLTLYDRCWIRAGVHGRQAPFIQQDSCFWRRELWQAAGGLRDDLRLAGDFDLWRRFAGHAALFGIEAHLSAFRLRPGQLSADLTAYRRECAQVSGPITSFQVRVGRYFRFERHIPAGMRPLAFRLCWGRPAFHLVRFDLDTGLPRVHHPRYYAP